ncbi:hypothetical protein GCM10009803_12560 [Microbacterium ginsengiterrae]
MLRSEFPWIEVIQGDGSLYWGAAMRRAEAAALSKDPDYLLWINDDAQLFESAIDDLLRVIEAANGDAIAVGAFQSTHGSGDTTYSGVVRNDKWGFMRLRQVDPTGTALPVSSFNGNLVLFPVAVYRRLGGMSVHYTHHYGDFDLGLRATESGTPVLLAPNYVGQTDRNTVKGTFQDSSLPRRQRIALLFGPKGYPFREKLQYLKSHGTPMWPVQLVSVHALYLLKILIGK